MQSSSIPSKRYDGKIVLVTGGGSGMGLAAAIRLAKEGAKGVAVVGRTESKLQEATRSIKEAAPNCEVLEVPGDVSTQQGNRDIVEKTVAKFGSIDCAFLNAGSGVFKPMAESTEEDFDSIFAVNAKSALFGIIAVAQCMKEQGVRGSILVNSSLLSRKVSAKGPPMSVYAASKAASDIFVKYAAVDYAEAGIRVNTVSPGIIYTDALGMSEGDADGFGGGAQVVNRAGRPHEVAATVAHLLADESAFITGANFSVDGGYELKG